MSCGIYKITNLVNGKSYIGQSICIEDRWNKEKARAFRPTYEKYHKTLFCAFRKYGLDNFSFEILEECPAEQLNKREQYYVELYDSYFNGYNETLGGQNGNQGNSIKLSVEQVLEIYDLLQHSDLPQKAIAEQYNVGQDVISTINHGKSRRLPGYEFPLRQKRTITKKCVDCGASIYATSIRCDACNKKLQRKVERPSREELKQMIRTLPFLQIGKKFGVSDNSVRKWCVSYGLPSKKAAIISYSDEEWELI